MNHPFHDLQREREVLAYAIFAADNRPEHLPTIRAALNPACFSTRQHTDLWNLICQIPWPTISAIGAEVAKRNGKGSLSLAFVTELEDEYPSHFPVVQDHIQTLKQLAVVRQTRACMEQALANNHENPLSAAYQASLDIKDILEKADNSRLADASLSCQDLMTTNFPDPQSILGSGLLSASDLAVFYGVGGVGKSYLALHLAICICQGKPWFGLPTHTASVAYLSLETPVHILKKRLEILLDGTNPPTNLGLVAHPILKGTLNILQTQDEIELTQYAKDYQLLIIDALSRIHTIDENQTSEMGLVMAAFDRLRLSTNCAVLILHHERKTQPGGSDDDIQALRGSSRLQTDPFLLIRARSKGDLIRISFPKSNNAPAPESLYVRPIANGIPEQVQAPLGSKAEKEENLMALKNAIRDTGGVLSIEEAINCLPHSRGRVTTQKLLKEIGAQPTGGHRGKKCDWQLIEDKNTEDKDPQKDTHEIPF